MGILSQCRCVKKKKRRLRKTASKENKHIFEWSDKCLDDALSYGIQISRYLLENVQVRDVRGMVDEHNKEAGRRVSDISFSANFLFKICSKALTLVGDYLERGYRDINIKAKISSLKVPWGTRLLDNNFHLWKIIPNKLFPVFLP